MLGNKPYTWHRIADNAAALQLTDHSIREVVIGDRTICVVLHQDTLYGCVHKCPHAGAALQNGHIDPLGNLVCPLHRYKFNLTNGRNVSGEGYFLKRFPVEQREDGLFVGLDQPEMHK